MAILLAVALVRWVGLPAAVWQPQMVMPPSVDSVSPEFSRIGDQRHLLVFSKTTGYRNYAAIASGQQSLEQLAADNFWFVYATENAAVFNVETLGQFDTVVFNNVSGPLFTATQQTALAAFVDGGGGVHRLSEQPADAGFRKRFGEQIRRAAAVAHADSAAVTRTPSDRRSRPPLPASRYLAPQS